MMEPVRISSKFTKEELEARKAVWNEVIRECGVLVSPFISSAEKEIRDAAIANGASLILITNINHEYHVWRKIQTERFPFRTVLAGTAFTHLCQ